MKRLAVSFSGGETSALMTWFILNGPMRDEYDEIVVVFANTGEEREETLEFVRDCDAHFGFDVAWVEAVVHHNTRRANSARTVTFATATRMNAENGPFEQSIRKYGIPNQKFKDCTRNLKQKPIEAYLRDHLGWGRDYDLAIGIRPDEIDRLSSQAIARRIVYPLVSRWPMTKPQVNEWWRQQPFRLRLKGYEGNCAWCWKKSLRKHITLLRENPAYFAFPHRMESTYAYHGPEFRKDTSAAPLPDGYRRTFFRANRSVQDLWHENLLHGDDFTPAADDHVVYAAFDPALDVGGGCEESCEVFSDEDAYDDEEND